MPDSGWVPSHCSAESSLSRRLVLMVDPVEAKRRLVMVADDTRPYDTGHVRSCFFE